MTQVLDVHAENWEQEVLMSGTLVVVDFWHEQCSWCKMLDPIYQEIASENKQKAKFVKINVSENQDNRRIAAKYGVLGTPTLVFFCNGKPVGSLTGFLPKEGLQEVIDSAAMKYPECIEKCTELDL